MASGHLTFIHDEEAQIKSIGTPTGQQSTTCGYCSPPGQRSRDYSSYHSAGLDAVRLTCEAYQKMIDRGWRRSGVWCYKPDLRLSCCPQYTIRLDALAFKPSKSQRKIINRWNRHILRGSTGEKMCVDPSPKSKGKEQAFDLVSSIRAAEKSFHSEEYPTHQFETTLELASFTDEKYNLYVRYQRDIHNDTMCTPGGFERFLVESPLQTDDILYPSPPQDHLPKKYGSYHHLYRLDGELVAMAVLDILPVCVSSVYFIYDTKWENFSLGKLSAMKEASLAREIHEAGVPNMGYLYMGFYIHSCQKMRYKGDYAPSYLADPETYQWYPLELCRPLLEKKRYACFSNTGHSIKGKPSKELLRQKALPLVDPSVLEQVRLLAPAPSPDALKFLVPVCKTPLWDYENIRAVYEACVNGLGAEVAQEIIFAL